MIFFDISVETTVFSDPFINICEIFSKKAKISHFALTKITPGNAKVTKDEGYAKRCFKETAAGTVFSEIAERRADQTKEYFTQTSEHLSINKFNITLKLPWRHLLYISLGTWEPKFTGVDSIHFIHSMFKEDLTLIPLIASIFWKCFQSRIFIICEK